jgi:hypothetical protein
VPGVATSVLAAAALAALAALAPIAGPRGGAEPSVAEAAYAALSPRDGLVYVAADTRWYSGGTLYQRVRSETWYSATRERSLVTSIGPRSGRASRYLELARDARRIRAYESGERTVTIQANCRPSGKQPRPTTVDPVAHFRSLYERGRLAHLGKTTFGGRLVSQLVASEEGRQLTYLVGPRTGELVALRVSRLPVGLRRPGPGFTGVVVRFSAHSRLPLDAASRGLLEMRPHPGAWTIHLGTARCPRG